MLLRDYKRARTAFDAAFGRLGRGVADEFASYAAAYGVDPKASALLMRELGTPAPSSDPAVTDLANAFARAATSGAGSEDAMTLARRLVEIAAIRARDPRARSRDQARPSEHRGEVDAEDDVQELGCEPLAK